MNLIYAEPYTVINDKGYPADSKIIVRKEDFNGTDFQDGKMTVSFVNCIFRDLEIENAEAIDFNNISIHFYACRIGKLKAENITSTNISLHFGASIFQGRIRNGNLQNVSVNNCILTSSLFLLELNSVQVTYTEENIFPNRWQLLFDETGLDLGQLLAEKQSFHIHDTRKIVYSVNENMDDDKGLYQTIYSKHPIDYLGYHPTAEDRERLFISLNIRYSVVSEHIQTKIINARLAALSIEGYCTGEVFVENSRIDDWYINEFSAQAGATFFDIVPFRKKLPERKLQIRKSNLDKAWFDNVSFDSYTIVNLYRNKIGQTAFTSCDFPQTYKGFEKFKTVENVHYPEKRDGNYLKARYETFLQMKRLLETSGNLYESQKLQSVSQEALKSIEGLPCWEKVILFINSKSNNHGLSIKNPLAGFFLFSIPLYILYLWSLGRMFNNNGIDWNLFGYYFSFLDITHRTDFLVGRSELNGLSATIDYLNKLVIGFFIYQFIAAFRKYGKK